MLVGGIGEEVLDHERTVIDGTDIFQLLKSHNTEDDFLLELVGWKRYLDGLGLGISVGHRCLDLINFVGDSDDTVQIRAVIQLESVFLSSFLATLLVLKFS